MICDCQEWKLSMPQIDGAQTLARIHGMEYTGSTFKVCPWCGMSLQEETKCTPELPFDQFEEVCKEIGCTGVDPEKCPGNPNCDILRKVLK